jgi:hypothetical protein
MKLKAEVDDQRRLLGELQRLAADTAGWDDEQRKRLETHRLDALAETGKAMLAALTDAAEKVSAADRLLSTP